MPYMPSERDSATLREMLHHIELAEEFGRERSVRDIRDDLMPLYAIVRCLEIISEASRRLSEEIKLRHGQIPWSEMAAAGNIYRHKYENVLPERVWKTLQEDLPVLRTAIEQELTSGE
jgi:uncharacterized protein with HEPN domain